MADTTTGYTSASNGGQSFFRILHISDIHFGRGFSEGRWENLKLVARSLKPDLIVVTGDLVNSPWRWMASKAKKYLLELSNSVSDNSNCKCPIRVVPGNHDTRLSGIFPVRWLVPLAGALSASSAALLSFAGGLHVSVAATAAALGFLSLIALILRLLLKGDLVGGLGEGMHLQQAYVTPCGRVGLIPLDSASSDISWARGRVAHAQMSKLKGEMESALNHTVGALIKPIWIALVHHHPLPMPYDAKHERMMVMDNAGAVLHELTSSGVRLVLHGHKHHQHFARIVVRAASRPYAELAVLSAGTPTQGYDGGAFAHGFNVVDVRQSSRVVVRPFQAPPEGGTFEAGEPFELAPSEHLARENYSANAARLPLECHRLLCVAEINDYGDGIFVRQFQGVAARNGTANNLGQSLVAAADAGVVEAFSAKTLSDHGPSVTANIRREAANRIEATIEFGDGLRQEIAPIDFNTQFFGSNAFALNRWQFRRMYPQRKEDYDEQLLWRVPESLAMRELILHVRFPPEAPFPRRFRFRIDIGTPEKPLWEDLPQDLIVRVEPQSVVQARIAHPNPNARYAIRWNIPEDPKRERSFEETAAISIAQELQERFSSSTAGDLPLEIAEILSRANTAAASILGAGDQKATPELDISLYAFDRSEKTESTLRYLIGSHSLDDARRKGRYAFGQGVVGRAFKSCSVASFLKPNEEPGERAWGYILPDGNPVANRKDVPEAAMLAFPLAPPKAPRRPYAVLVISTDTPGNLKTTDTATDGSIELFAKTMSELTHDLHRMMRSQRRSQ